MAQMHATISDIILPGSLLSIIWCFWGTNISIWDFLRLTNIQQYNWFLDLLPSSSRLSIWSSYSRITKSGTSTPSLRLDVVSKLIGGYSTILTSQPQIESKNPLRPAKCCRHMPHCSRLVADNDWYKLLIIIMIIDTFVVSTTGEKYLSAPFLGTLAPPTFQLPSE